MYIVRFIHPSHEPGLKRKFAVIYHQALHRTPIKLAKIAIGNGALTILYVFEFLPMVRTPLLFFPPPVD